MQTQGGPNEDPMPSGRSARSRRTRGTRWLVFFLLCGLSLHASRGRCARDEGPPPPPSASEDSPPPPGPQPPAAPPLPAAPETPPQAAAPVETVPFGGVVLEKGTRNPLAGIRVTLVPWREAPPDPAKPRKKGGRPAGEPAGEAIETTTDASGRFELPEVLPGPQLLTLRGPLIERVESLEHLDRGKKKTITYYAPPKLNRWEAVVRAESVRREVSEQVLSVEELKRIPGTQNDVLKAVQNLPGVARAPLGGGLLVVWGSAPGDTRIYADGVFIPRAFHFGGFRATINSEFVDSLSFRPGAYAADYGRGLGGVIEVTTRAPKSDRLHGSVTLDLIDGSVTLEGPLTKKLHVAAGARVSWIAAFIPLFNTSNFQISPSYWDYQLSLRYKPTSRDDLDLFLFGSTDNLEARVDNPDPVISVNVDSKSYFSRARLRWTHRFSNTTTLTVMPSVGADVFNVDFAGGNLGGVALDLGVLQLGYNLRAELRDRIRDWFTLSGGIDFEGMRSTFDVTSPTAGGGGSSGDGTGQPRPAVTLLPSLREQSVLHTLRTAAYAIARFEFADRRIVVSPQIRLETAYVRQYDGEVSRTLLSPEPRLFVSAQLVPRYLLFKVGVGTFSQLGQPQEINRTFGNPDLEFQRGTTYVVGLESEPTSTLFLQGQFFYKDLRLMIVNDPSQRFANGGLGRVTGGDFLLRQRLWRGLFGWVAYTLSKSERQDSPQQPWRLFRWDQTHILTLVASYKLPWWGLEVGVRFRYVTGNPMTPVTGAVRDAVTQTWMQTYGEPYSARLPDFHQLDVRVDKTWIFNRWKLGLYLDVQNLYNQKNTETVLYGGRQLYQSTPITGLPFFPNLGLRADF